MKKDDLFETVKSYTILSQERKNTLYKCAMSVVQNDIKGDFVECGTFNGGSAGIMCGVLQEMHADKRVWLFDSFEGLPNPTTFDVDSHGIKGEKGLFAGSEQKVRELLFEKLKIDEKQTQIIKGWFENTIPINSQRIKSISLLHLDGDFYESTKICLEYLFDKIESGGYLIIDDYGRWEGCKKAIDEFFNKRNIPLKFEKSDYTGRYYKRT
jgi:O-methyltransferase